MKESLLWVGNHSRDEFKRVVNALRPYCDVDFVSDSNTVRPGARTPAMICLASSRSGEHSVSDWERWQNKFPNAYHLWILGELCCGMKRSLADAQAVYTHELPVDLTLDALLALSTRAPQGKTRCEGDSLVAMYFRPASNGHALADALREIGLKTILLSPQDTTPVQGVDYVIWGGLEAFDQRKLQQLRRQHSNAKFVVLATFPREYEIAMCHDLGIRVLSQPFNLRDLFSIFGQRGQIFATSAA